MSSLGLPNHLLALFAPRPPLNYVPLKPNKEHKPFDGLADYLNKFEVEVPQPLPPFEAPKERKARLKKEKLAQHILDLEKKLAEYDPHKDEAKVKTVDPRKTLFVGRLSYETTEKKLLRTFEVYGPICDIRLVKDKLGKPRGYAFIEFKNTESVRTAFREADDKLIDGRKIVVDIEKARTYDNWKPRRLGGGEGPPRMSVSKKVLQQRAHDRRVAMASNAQRTPGPGGRGGPRSSGVGGGGGYRGGRGGRGGGAPRDRQQSGPYGGNREREDRRRPFNREYGRP